MKGIEKLASTLKGKHGSPIITGTVVGTDALDSRSLVEVQLFDGTMTNAICWTQADVNVGDDVVLAHVGGSDTATYAIVSTNSPAQGLDPDERDPDGTVMLYDGDTFRVKRIPNPGVYQVVRETQCIASTTFQTYTKIHATLDFSIYPTGTEFEYHLDGYAVGSNLGGAPPFRIKLGETWKSPSLRRWRTTFDLGAPGYMGDWLEEQNEVSFVLTFKSLNSSIRCRDIGRIDRLYLAFGRDIENEFLELSSHGDLAIEMSPVDEGESLLEATTNLRLDKHWVEMDGAVDVEFQIFGSVDGVSF